MVSVNGNKAVFQFYRPQAAGVEIVGDFGSWGDGAVHMDLGTDGYWRATLMLPKGEFHFRYRADGRYFTDFAAFGVEQGDFGLDSIVRIQSVA